MRRTFQQCADDPLGELYYRRHSITPHNIVFRIQRGLNALCAYIGVPADSPLVGEIGSDYESEVLNTISVHGGFTFAGTLTDTGAYNDSEYHLWGWDYSHSGDYAFYYLREHFIDNNAPFLASLRRNAKMWDPTNVFHDCNHVVPEFKALCDRLVAARPPPIVERPPKPFGLTTRRLSL